MAGLGQVHARVRLMGRRLLVGGVSQAGTQRPGFCWACAASLLLLNQPILAPLVQRRGLRDSAEGKVLGDRQVRAPAQQCVHLQQGPQASPKPATLTAHCSHFSRRPSETLATPQILPSLVRFTLPLKKNFIKMIPGSNFLNFHTPHPTLLDTYTALPESPVSGWVFSRAPSSPVRVEPHGHHHFSTLLLPTLKQVQTAYPVLSVGKNMGKGNSNTTGGNRNGNSHWGNCCILQM